MLMAIWLSVSMPVGRSIFTMRSWMMNTALQMIARVSAICRAMRMAPVLLRSSALRMGRISMMSSSLDLEIERGGYAHHAPGGIEAGQDARNHGERDPHAHHG